MTSRMSNMTALIIGLAGVAIILKVPRKDIGQARQRISSYSRLGAGAYRSYPESKNMNRTHLNKLKPAFADIPDHTLASTPTGENNDREQA